MGSGDGRQLQHRLDVRAETSSFAARHLLLWAFQSSQWHLELDDVFKLMDFLEKEGLQVLSADMSRGPSDATSTRWSLVMEPTLVGPDNSIQSLT
jgi:hypothetical protein